MHPEPLLEMARNVASTVVRDENKLKVEEPENETEREKLKKIPRFPDPQLPKVEQKEAIGIFSRFSPCIPPDTTSRQQVRTQGFPPSSLHPTSPLMSSFVPHVGPHGPHFPVEMFPMSIARGPGYPLYPQFVEYFQHPGMDPEHLVPIAPFSARLMEEAALHQAHSMWSHFDRREMLFGAHPPYMIASDINRSTPPENVSRGRENTRRESNSGVTPTRCRSVEAAVIHSRAHTPEHHILNDVRPGIQQRSFSLSDVHSRVTSIPDERRASPFHQAPKPLPQLVQTPKDQDSDHVKSYEPFNVLINAAAGAKPMKSVEKVSRSAQEHPTKPLKKEEAESSPTHFTRQSCVVTNTSVIHATSFDPRTIGRQSPSDRPRYGISTGLVPKPPPLMPITGLRSQSNPRQTESPDCGEVSVAEHATPFGVVKEAFSPCPNISEKAEIRPSHVMQTSPTYYPIKQQQHPPPLIRNTPLSENRVQSPLSMVKDCRCGNEPCKHQLYSQGVPYVQRGDNLPKMTSVEQENESVGHVSPAYTVPLNTRPADTSSGGSTPLFRPWIENLGAEKDMMKATESMTPSPNVFPSILEHSSPELSHISGGLSIYSGQNPVRPLHFTDVRVEISNSSPLEATSSTDRRKSLGVPHESFPRPSKRSPYQDASLFALPTSNAPGFRSSALPGVACADTPISPLSQTSATLHTSSSFPGSRRTALLPSLSSRGSLSTILVEADSVSGQSPSSQHECEHSSTADSCTVTSSEESLGRTASDQTVDKETDSDRGSNLEPSPGHESSDEIETGGQGETEVMPAGSKDPEELTSCYSSSESEDTVASKTLVASSGVVAPEVSIELNKPKELRKETVEHSISNSDGISTSQSDTAFGDFFESSSADDNVDSSQSPNYTSRMQPAPAANTASGDPIGEYGSDELQLRENKTCEELEDRELNSTRKDKMEVKDDSRATEEVMKSMEETELDSDKREKDLRDSGDNEESEVISGTGEDEISLRNKAEEHNEAVNEVTESELEDKENDGGQNGEGLDDDMDDGVELRDKNYVPEDEVTSSMEHVNVRDSNGKDNKLLDDVREHEEDMRHDGDAEEAEVVSGTMNSCTEVRDNYDTDEGDIISDIQGRDKDVMQNDGTCEDESVGGIMNDEVKSSHSTPVKETEESETAIEGNDEMVKLEINEKEAGKKMDEMAESLSADEVVNIDENQETVEDNVYSLVESGMVVSEEEENTYSDKEEREDRTVDTSNVDPLSRIHNKSTVEEQCADSEKDKQHEECEVSSVCQQPDTKGKILVAYSCDQNEISKETGTTENDSGTDDVTGSDEPETMTTETSHVTTEPTSAPPPNSVSGACISEKQDDVLSTSEIPSGQQMGSVDVNELCRGQDETSEVETTVDKIPFDSSAVNDLNKTQNIVDLDGRNDIGAEPRIDVEDTSNVESGECSEKSTTTNLNEDLSDHRELQPFGESDITETPSSGNEAESLVIIDQDHNSGETEKTVDTGSSSPARVTSASTELDKYGIKIEEISSDEEYSASELEEGEIAETPGNNDVTQTPDRVVESSDSYFPPLNTIPISPPGCDNHSEISHTAFLGWEHPYVHVHSSTEPLSENPNESTGLSDPASSSRVSHSVPFPYSALNVRSAPNSGCSSPVPLSFTSGCSTPVIFQRQGSNTPLSEHYEPLSDDENGEHSKSDSESVRTLSESDDG